MLLLARPYPDEPIAGALVRGCRQYLVPMKHLLNPSDSPRGKGNGLAFFGLSPLPFFSELFDMTPQELLAGHTVLPFATAFSEYGVWERGIASALAGASGSQAIGAVVQNAIHGIPFRRFCRACVADDLRTRGESAWRVAHQLPGSLVCHVHGDVLRATGLRIVGTSVGYTLPQDHTGQPCIAGPLPAIWQQVAGRVAELACRGLTEPVARTGSHYRDMAVQRGWLRLGRDVNAERLSKLFIDRFGQSALDACGLASTGKVNWAALMLHSSPHVPFATLKHVLLELLLTGTSVDLSHKPRGPSARPTGQEDTLLTAAFSKVAKNYAAKGVRAPMAAMLREAGCWSAYRKRRQVLPKLRRAVEKVQSSERACRPQALQMLEVPGQHGLAATRQDLIKAGHLVCSEDAAARLGIHWYRMKPLQRSGRIFSVRYAGRDWYPAFWFDGSVAASVLEAALADTANLPPREKWSALVRLWKVHQ